MPTYRLIPLDDTVVFPGMPVTLPVDVGHRDPGLPGPPPWHRLRPRRASSPRWSSGCGLPGGGRAVGPARLHRGVAGAARADHDGVLRVEVEERPDVTPPPPARRELEREYRAVVDEILELRGDDGRIRAFVRSITEPGALADTVRLLARPDLRAEGRAAARRSTSSSA